MFTNKQIAEDLEKDLEVELSKDEAFANENYSREALKKFKLTNGVMKFIMTYLLKSFKIKISFFYKEKEIFTFEIPKN